MVSALCVLTVFSDAKQKSGGRPKSTRTNITYRLKTNFHCWFLSVILLIDEIPAKYYYGTHYSSAMSVASFLIRMEPFTHYFVKLQVLQFHVLLVLLFDR